MVGQLRCPMTKVEIIYEIRTKMRKKLYILSLALLCAFVAVAQTPWYKTDSVSLGKELPRGDVVSYASADDAVRKTFHKSQYLVPLTEFTKESYRADYNHGEEAIKYTTSYKLPFAWLDRELLLHVGKADSAYEIWVNGKRVGFNQTASTPAEWDLTRYSVEGNNSLEIRVWKECMGARLEDNRTERGQNLDGEVYLLAQPKVRVRDVAVATEMSGTNGLLSLGVIVKSHLLNTKEYKVYYELISPKGDVVAADYRDITIGLRSEDTVTFFRRIPDVMSWSHEQPCLYTLVVKTQHEGRFKEYVSFNIGFRTIAVDTEHTITLNGVPLRVVATDYAPKSDIKQVEKDIASLRDEGYTMLNVVGAPQSRSFYELCDSMGMYVCARADIDTHKSGDSRKVGGNPSNNPQFLPFYMDRMESLYHSTKNYPCVIMYALAANPANGYNLYESYIALKRIEKSRPIVLTGSDEWNNDSLNTKRMSNLRRTNLKYWVALLSDDVNSGRITIANTRHYTPLIGDLRYTVKVGRKTISQGTIPVRVLPKRESTVEIPLKNIPQGRLFEISVEVVRDIPIDKYEVDAERSTDGQVRLAYKVFKGVL